MLQIPSPDDYNTKVADNLTMMDVGTAVADDAANDATAADGDAVGWCGHLQCGQLSLVIVLKMIT